MMREMAAGKGKKSTSPSGLAFDDRTIGIRRERARQHVEEARARICGEAIAAGLGDPQPLLRSLADSFDQLLAALFADVSSPGACVALVALGSYGRRQLFPYSDIDLLLIHQQLDAAEIERIVAGVIYPLWDARVAVGHAVRSIDETLDLAGEDLTLRTALLDARLIAGDAGPFHALAAGAYRELFGPERLKDLQHLLVEERRRRHERFGETVYLLEPHIKSGAGGLRDINTGLWAAKARFGVRDLDELADAGAATARQQAELESARGLLSRLRLAMHVSAGRAQDRLLFELQEELAPSLFPSGELGVKPLLELHGAPSSRPSPTSGRHALAPAVERLMHAFYRAARSVALESEGLVQRCVAPRGVAKRTRILCDHFAEVDGSLESRAPERFWQQPSALLRAFAIARDEGLRIGRALQDTISEAAAGEAGAQLLADGEAIRLWRQLLVEAEPSGAAPASGPDDRLLLERMHDLGVLAALIPEFEPCTGRVQHDLYHVYTVDRHTLYVVGWLKRLRAGLVPGATTHAFEVMQELDAVESLYLGALLHDVAKPLGAEHADKGARLAAGVVARLGLEAAAQREVVFLVRHHLTMQHISQRRDLGDPAVIASFAELVGDARQLGRLYLLALADTAMTAPGNLTEWKASLLQELYERAAGRLRGDAPALGRADEAVLQERRAELLRELRAERGAAAVSLVGRLPAGLVLAQPLPALLQHAGVLLDFEGGAALASLAAQAHDEATTLLTICCHDAAGVLSSLTGALVLHGIDVLAAQVYTIDPPSGVQRGTALDVFWVPTPSVATGSAADVTQPWEALRETLRQVLAGEIDLRAQLSVRLRAPTWGRRLVPHVQTRVTLDADSSEHGTILDLQAPDRPGLLYVVTQALSELGLEIVASRVATEAGRAIDTFYLRDRDSGEPVRARLRLAAIAEAVRAAVQEPAGATVERGEAP